MIQQYNSRMKKPIHNPPFNQQVYIQPSSHQSQECCHLVWSQNPVVCASKWQTRSKSNLLWRSHPMLLND